MSNIVVKESGVSTINLSNRDIQLRETLLGLAKFDISKLDAAKVIYYKKKDVEHPFTWTEAIWEGLQLCENYPEFVFDLEVTMAQYSTENQCYELSTHKIPNIKGRNIPAYLADNLEYEFYKADLVKIDARRVSMIKRKPYNISCVYARSDLES